MVRFIFYNAIFAMSVFDDHASFYPTGHYATFPRIKYDPAIDQNDSEDDRSDAPVHNLMNDK